MYNSLASFSSPLLSSLRHRRSSMIRRSREYYPSSFLLKRVGCIFNTKRVSLPSMLFFFSFRSFPGRAAIFCIQKRVFTALVFGAGFTRNGVRISREGCCCELVFENEEERFANFQDSNYVKLFSLFVRSLSEQLGSTRRRKKELDQTRSFWIFSTTDDYFVENWSDEEEISKRRGNRIYWTGGNGDSRTWRQRGGAHTQFTT